MTDDLLGDLRYCAHIHEGRSRHECIGQAAELLSSQSDEIERLREENGEMLHLLARVHLDWQMDCSEKVLTVPMTKISKFLENLRD